MRVTESDTPCQGCDDARNGHILRGARRAFTPEDAPHHRFAMFACASTVATLLPPPEALESILSRLICAQKYSQWPVGSWYFIHRSLPNSSVFSLSRRSLAGCDA